tara:strand:+ start:434 stop:601 length:168 start_codon:yes stop_codon:yes gene_type:complete
MGRGGGGGGGGGTGARLTGVNVVFEGFAFGKGTLEPDMVLNKDLHVRKSFFVSRT